MKISSRIESISSWKLNAAPLETADSLVLNVNLHIFAVCSKIEISFTRLASANIARGTGKISNISGFRPGPAGTSWVFYPTGWKSAFS